VGSNPTLSAAKYTAKRCVFLLMGGRTKYLLESSIGQLGIPESFWDFCPIPGVISGNGRASKCFVPVS
jgi:hypothetical protein